VTTPGRSGVSAAGARDPPLRGRLARRVDRARLHRPDRGVTVQHVDEPGDHVVTGQEGVIVVEEDDVAAHGGRTDIAALGDAHVLREVDGPDPLRQALREPAVPDDHHLEVDVVLGQQ